MQGEGQMKQKKITYVCSVYFSQGLLWEAEVRAYYVQLVSSLVPFSF